MGHDADHVLDEGLEGKPDDWVWKQAQVEGRVFFTFDLDFSDIRAFAPGTHAGLVLMRIADEPMHVASRLVVELVREQADLAGAFVVVDPTKVRVIRAVAREDV
jgi:predicted nuclease of predicted toxin-antitoxin system